jgi:hypothetical protein
VIGAEHGLPQIAVGTPPKTAPEEKPPKYAAGLSSPLATLFRAMRISPMSRAALRFLSRASR